MDAPHVTRVSQSRCELSRAFVAGDNREAREE